MKHDVTVPSAGESITEVYIGTWRKKTGDIVKKNEILVEIETQKATFELQAEQTGRLEVLKPDRDTVVKIGEVVATIDDSASAGAEDSKAPAKTEAPAAQAKTSASEPVLSPAARKMAEEKNIAPQSIAGTGKGGRITKEDVAKAPAAAASSAAAPAAAAASSVPSAPVSAPPVDQPDSHLAKTLSSLEVDVSRGERREPASRIRRQIAENLVMAQRTAAILTTFNEVDMTQVLEFRAKHKDDFKKKHGSSLGMVGFFAKACVRAIKELPLVNSTFTGDEVISRDFVDLSIAVSTERGLVVPVIRDIQKMKLVDFEKKLAELSEKARSKKLSIPEMTGGTFTISNGGVFGSLLSTPILNMPQSGILGLHKTQDRPMAIDGKVVIRPMMYVALSYDHRLIDGREAVQFLVKVKEGIENLSLIVDEKDL